MATQGAKQQNGKKMRTIGRWYIGETLGKGGYSWVKKGFDKKTGKCVALKFMAKADESWAKEQSKQVVTEIESLKQIRHPHVMKLYAYNLNARYPTKNNEKIDTVLLVLEFAPGGEIFDILYYTSALEPILARTYFRQSIFGLEACHNAGVAHRDIKPQNLLLDSRFNIKLTDFGLSKVFESDADAIMKTTYVGTRGYQAPELLLDKPYDLACDIFSMGVVLFILITGYPPFEQAHYSDRWFRPIAKGDYNKFWKYHTGCSISNDAKCKDLLEKMLCFDPKKRATIAQIKKHAWFNLKFLEGKELIRALRHRHREMESKRRRDARKVHDLQHSINKDSKRSLPDLDQLEIPEWPINEPEQVLANSYTYCNPAEFFSVLSDLVHQLFQGEIDEFEPNQGRLTFNVTVQHQMNVDIEDTLKKGKKQTDGNDKENNNNNDDSDDDLNESIASIKAIKQCDYKFEIQLFKSAQYVLYEDEENEKKANEKEVDNQAADADKEAHSGKSKKQSVYVVRTKRISGDELKFQKIRNELVKRSQIFTGLPEWAEKLEKNSDPFEKFLKEWKDVDDVKDAEDDEDYNDINWDDDN